MNNDPRFWSGLIPLPGANSHKYARGHAVILGGSRMTGAAKLASLACMRLGAGLCTIVADRAVAAVYQSGAPHVLYEPLTDWAEHLKDPRRNAVLIGPGAGQDAANDLRAKVMTAISSSRYLVLDADALNVFAGRTTELFAALNDHCVLTPHDGEFIRLFGEMPGTREDRALAAARLSKAVVVLKGAETVIAHPDGRVVVNNHSSPYLATAGSGDVLAGMILGLLAQGMPVYEAACAAVWIHGDAALRFGPGLVAPDIIEQIPGILRELT
ncbi:MAG: NAD(P)H-hydrate dehydratase [Micavibrio sp.]